MKHINNFEDFNRLNEGKLQRGILKGALDLSILVKKFKSLFNKSERTRVLKNIKDANKIIDLITFLKDNERWLSNENLTLEDIKRLADNIGIEKDIPTVWDIFKYKYKKEFNREFKSDLNDIDKSLDEPTTSKNPDHIAYLKDLSQMVKGLKDITT